MINVFRVNAIFVPCYPAVCCTHIAAPISAKQPLKPVQFSNIFFSYLFVTHAKTVCKFESYPSSRLEDHFRSPVLSYMNGPTMYYCLSVSILTFSREGNLLKNYYTYAIYCKLCLHCSTQLLWLVSLRDRNQIFFTEIYIFGCGPGGVVGIATGYGLDGPGIESQWGRDFPHLSRLALGPTHPPVR